MRGTELEMATSHHAFTYLPDVPRLDGDAAADADVRPRRGDGRGARRPPVEQQHRLPVAGELPRPHLQYNQTPRDSGFPTRARRAACDDDRFGRYYLCTSRSLPYFFTLFPWTPIRSAPNTIGTHEDESISELFPRA